MMPRARPERLPPWLRVRQAPQERLAQVKQVVRSNHLRTVCEGASCPNRIECWNAGTATFMIMGNVCTRACRFCNVQQGSPAAPDRDEPDRVAHAVAALRIRYAVITSVTRDDLPDGGAVHFADTIKAIRANGTDCGVEVLIPDLQGSQASLQTMINAAPSVLAHNIETVPSLYHTVRPQASYNRSLALLSRASEQGMTTKSGLMIGLGETIDEIETVLRDLTQAGCAVVTIGQYLQPSRRHLAVRKYYQPQEFEHFARMGQAAGLKKVIAGPLVRSSYHAGEIFPRPEPKSAKGLEPQVLS